MWVAPLIAALCAIEVVAFWSPLAAEGLRPPGLGIALSGLLGIAPFLAGAAVVRASVWTIARRKGGGPAPHGRAIRAALWDVVWITVALALVTMAYEWTKVMLPAFGGHLWDGRLQRADLVLSFGVNPNVVLLEIFRSGPRWAARALDWYYNLFVTTMLAGTAWFLTDSRPERRRGLAVGVTLLWSLGLLGYVAFPALGPAMAFEGLWEEVRAVFPIAAFGQRALVENYRQVLDLLASPGKNVLVTTAYGVAAMPSLHVGAHTLLFVWAHRTRSPLAGLLLGMAILTFLASIATGWHYAVDSWAGLLLGWGTARIAHLVAVRLAESGTEAGAAV